MYNTAEILLLGNNVKDDCLSELKSKVDCHDVVNMQYTSGTTGFPKGVMLTHYNIANNGFLTGEHMKFTADDKLCCCVPLFHCFGVVLATMNCLTHGCTQVMVERFDPLIVLASIHKERCTALYGVPTMFIAELHHPMFDLFDMSCLRTGIIAGHLDIVPVGGDWTYDPFKLTREGDHVYGRGTTDLHQMVFPLPVYRAVNQLQLIFLNLLSFPLIMCGFVLSCS